MRGTAKLADFGMALVSQVSAFFSEVVGAVGYQCRNFRKTKWLSEGAEVFSFGIILFDLLTRGQTARHGPPQIFVVAKNQVEQLWPQSVADALVTLALECTGDFRPSFASVVSKVHSLAAPSSTSMPSSTYTPVKVKAPVAATILETLPLQQPQPKGNGMKKFLERVNRGVPP